MNNNNNNNTRLFGEIDKIHQKLETIDSRVDLIHTTLSVQHEVLAEHQRRSLANEKAVEVIKDELKPIVTHVHVMNIIGKILLMAAGSGVFYKILQVIFRISL